MFQFPGFAPDGIYILPPVTPSGYPVASGCPIRTSPDQSLFGGSPELIAACRVLHRLCTPRHPPYTLSSLTTFMKRCGQDAPSLQETEKKIDLSNQERTKSNAGRPPTTRAPAPTRITGLDTYSYPPMNLSKNSRQLSALSRQPEAHDRQLLTPANRGLPGTCQCPEVRDPLFADSLDWSRPGSNRQPPRCKRGALPTELRPRTSRPGHA